MDTTKIDGEWYERRWHWTGTKTDAGLGYSLRPLTDFEAKREEKKNEEDIKRTRNVPSC